MTTITIDRAAVEQALEALETYPVTVNHWKIVMRPSAEALRAALAQEQAEPVQEPDGGGNLPPPLREPEEFDYGIGSGRFKVVRGAYWWHVLIGESPTRRGKFHTQAGAEEMAALLLREFRNGAFTQHKTAPAEPVQMHPSQFAELIKGKEAMIGAPVYWAESRTQAAWKMDYEERRAEQAEPAAKVELMTTGGNAGLATRIVEIDDHLRERLRPGQLLYTAPQQPEPADTDCHAQGICQRSGYTIGKQPTPCPDCLGIGYDASGQLCACQQNPSF